MSEKASREAIIIRRATEADAVAIAALTTELGYPVEANIMRARVCAVTPSPSDFLVVATSKAGETVGWLQAHAASSLVSGLRVEIAGLIVSPAVRRSGIGRLLVAAAERWAAEIHAKTIIVRSSIKRRESHDFYPALGFTAAKTQHVYRKSLVKAQG